MIDIAYLLKSMVQYTHFISFGLLLLAGFNIPVSEDLVFIISASIAATAVPENSVKIFAGCFLGAYLSDITAYMIGRYGINRILYSPLLVRTRIVNPVAIEDKLQKAKGFFDRYGGKALFFGRFVPFGVRNVIFMSCGLIQVPAFKFLMIDLCALACTSTVLFILGYSFGNNYQIILTYISRYKIIIFIFFALLVLFFLIRKRIKRTGNSAHGKTLSGTDIPKNDSPA
jgi:membrane-associated protein